MITSRRKTDRQALSTDEKEAVWISFQGKFILLLFVMIQCHIKLRTIVPGTAVSRTGITGAHITGAHVAGPHIAGS